MRKLLLHKKKNTHEIFKSGVRNGIEHFDERVDLMNSKILLNEKQLNGKALLYNITLSSKRVFEEWNQVLPFKVYIVESGEYFMTDHLFEEQVVLLHEIFDEVLRIQNNCIAWAAKRPDKTGKIMDRPSGIIKTPRHEI